MFSKVLFTLNVNDYAPKIREITYPLLKHYAHKIGAEFREITERKWPDWPPVYEKLQIHQLGIGYDWVIYFDADVLVHPNCIDFTNYLPRDTCAHNGQDFGNVRFRYDEAMRQDRRNIGTCGWCVITPAPCLDAWKPTDRSLQEILDCCYPTVEEINCGMVDKGHLTDDYVVSQNIARFKFKHVTIQELLPKIGSDPDGFFWHLYTIGEEEKVRQMRDMLWRWRVPHPVLARGWEEMFK